jgi:hypothetical protein
MTRTRRMKVRKKRTVPVPLRRAHPSKFHDQISHLSSGLGPNYQVCWLRRSQSQVCRLSCLAKGLGTTKRKMIRPGIIWLSSDNDDEGMNSKLPSRQVSNWATILRSISRWAVSRFGVMASISSMNNKHGACF